MRTRKAYNIMYKDKKLLEICRVVAKKYNLPISTVEKMWGYFINWQVEEFKSEKNLSYRWSRFGVFDRRPTQKNQEVNNRLFKIKALQNKSVLSNPNLKYTIPAVNEFDTHDPLLLKGTVHEKYIVYKKNSSHKVIAFNYVNLYLADLDEIKQVLEYLLTNNKNNG